MSRVADMPVYEQQQVEVTAQIYNLWCRAKLRLSCPVRFPLKDYRGLVMILDKREWLCADETQNDLPVIAWLDFCDKRRDNLHLPIPCTLNYYHYAADKISAQVLELVQAELISRLSKKKTAQKFSFRK
ncbi:MAG: hypothetical protein QM479_14075 [Pseudomonadota bacterium]